MVLDKILVFVPMYNCERQITRVLAQFDERILPYVTEILLVNNRSTDGTEEAAVAYAKAHPELLVTVVRNHENYGLGGSHKVAFQYAMDHGFDYVVVLHGDDQGHIENLLPYFASGEYRNYDCFLGARFQRGAVLDGYSRFRTFGNRVYNLLFSLVVRQWIYDLGSGLNMYAVPILKNHFYLTQTSHTENIPYALKNQPKLDIKIHSRTPLPAQSAHPKGRRIVHETLQ